MFVFAVAVAAPVQLTAGLVHACVRTDTGEVWCWGDGHGAGANLGREPRGPRRCGWPSLRCPSSRARGGPPAGSMRTTGCGVGGTRSRTPGADGPGPLPNVFRSRTRSTRCGSETTFAPPAPETGCGVPRRPFRSTGADWVRRTRDVCRRRRCAVCAHGDPVPSDPLPADVAESIGRWSRDTAGHVWFGTNGTRTEVALAGRATSLASNDDRPGAVSNIVPAGCAVLEGGRVQCFGVGTVEPPERSDVPAGGGRG